MGFPKDSSAATDVLIVLVTEQDPFSSFTGILASQSGQGVVGLL